MNVNKLIKSDIIDTVYKRYGQLTYTNRLKKDCLSPYITTITRKLDKDTVEINNKIFDNGNKFRTFITKNDGANPILNKIQVMLDSNNNILKLKSSSALDKNQEKLLNADLTEVFNSLK